MAKTLKIVDGDIVRNVNNSSYTYLTGREKSSQDVKSTLTTSINPITNLGASLEQVVGLDANNPISQYSTFPPMFAFQTRVEIALRRLKIAQRKYLYAQRTTDELINDFTDVQIWAVRNDPRMFGWRVGITTVRGEASFQITGSSRQ